jgi:hypothetical protein
MKFSQLETTFICQFNKPQNRAMLEEYVARKDKSYEESIRYYLDVTKALKGTPAWGVSGVNKMLNELTAATVATLTKAKKGKTTAYAHAAKLLRYINFYSNQEVEAKYNGRHKLEHVLTEAELNQLMTLA